MIDKAFEEMVGETDVLSSGRIVGCVALGIHQGNNLELLGVGIDEIVADEF